MNNPSAPLTERRYIMAFVLVTSLFFMWALGVNLNDILIPHLKKAFRLTDLQSSLIQSAFFGGYFLAARRMADGTHRVQEGHFAGLAHLRGRGVSIHPCSFDRAVRLLSLCIVRDGLRAGRAGGRGQPVRYHSWTAG